MARLGDALRLQREQMGVTLAQAADDTRIRLKFLEAVESGDYQSLPGNVYTKGFLRNYAEYLNLDPDEMVALYVGERGGIEPLRSFAPMRPLVKRSFIFTPAVLVPVLVLAGIVLFVAYFYYQFTSFAVAPHVDITDPSGDAISQTPQFTLKGKANPDGRITVTVSPGLEPIPEVKPNADGTFSVTVPLKPGSNHVDVEVLDPSGKQARASRTITLVPATGNERIPLVVEQPANGAVYTNAAVTVTGRIDPAVSTPIGSLSVNGIPATIGSDGRFSVPLTFPAGSQTIRVVGKTASGAEVQETRTVTIAYTTAIVTVRIIGGDAWIQVTVDGQTQASTGKIFPNGSILPFNGKTVAVRTGNAGMTYLSFNGQDLGKMGEVGQVTERSFSSP